MPDEEDDKITLVIKNVSAESRHAFNRACSMWKKDKGEVISEYMDRAVQEIADEIYLQQMKEMYRNSKQAKNSKNRTAEFNAETSTAKDEPLNLEASSPGLDCE